MRKIFSACIVIILVLTVLEFPAPLGFETRPQDNVSLWWLGLFAATVLSEVLALRFIFSRPAFGAKLGMIDGVLNIAMVIADQFHLMQPEVATIGYLVLEDLVAITSVILISASWKMLRRV